MTTVRKNKTLKPKLKSVVTKSIKSQSPLTQKKEIISIHQLSKIAMVFWIGGSLMSAIVIFPLLFRTLDPITASQLVGVILNILAYMGVVCLLIAFVEVVINHKFALLKTKRFWYILMQMAILILNYFAIFPAVSKFRQQLSNVAHQMISVQSNVFDFWHSLSAITFILSCIIGVLYLIEM